MKQLPLRRLENCTMEKVRVSKFSTIRVRSNTYSVSSQLIKENVNVKIYPENLEVWYDGKKLHIIPRLHGKNKHRINYRHVIHSLIRKPGAFHNYRYQDDLFPSIQFRMTYDELLKTNPSEADKEYVKILHLAATQSEVQVNNILKNFLSSEEEISFEKVHKALKDNTRVKPNFNFYIKKPNLQNYNDLYKEGCLS